MANPHPVSKILTLALILYSSLLPNSDCKDTTREAEKTALLNIERDWGRPAALNWSSIRYTDQCDWPGISCADGFVTRISLAGCHLNKPIPQAICSLHNLMRIDLSYNHITGSFPTTLFNCSRLQYLDLSHNAFNGVLPSNIHHLSPKLEYLSLASNHIFGNIPSTISQLYASFLYLDDNMLSGLPSTIWSMMCLKELTLRKNNLSGEIPDAFGSAVLFRQLNIVDFSENNLSGPIPKSFAMLEPTFLNLSSNRLTGQIPSPFMIDRYERSFLSNPGLCSFDRFGNLSLCIKQPEEDPEEQRKLLKRPLIVVLVLGSVILVCTGAFGFLKSRTFLLRQKRSAPSPLWKLTTFYPVNFNVQDILCGLSNNNLVGSGGSGMVYKICLNNSNCKVIAVKKISNGQTKDDILEKQFQAEIETLGSIRHANIVKLLGCISSSKSKLLIYEYMEQGSVYDWLHQKDLTSTTEGLSWPMRMSIAIDAARGMCYMHHDYCPPIAHRDVKSSNILLDLEYKAKIADFGLARALAKAGEPESISVMVGSFGYMAPEFGSVRKINEKIDVYSFGVVLLELTTGRRATGEDGEHENLAQWAWRRFQEATFQKTDVIDKKIQDASNLHEVQLVFKLGLIWTGTKPSSRPSMKEVLQVLQR